MVEGAASLPGAELARYNSSGAEWFSLMGQRMQEGSMPIVLHRVMEQHSQTPGGQYSGGTGPSHTGQHPPLPPNPPPPQTQQQTQQQQHYTQHHAACCGGMPPHSSFQHQPQSWQHDGYVVHHNPDLPPISNLLLREADAWRAVLSLHAATVSTSYQLARMPDNQQDSPLHYEEEREMNSESREATYCSALTGLASQCDSLIAEIFKLRTLRKARRAVEVQCVKEIVRSHSDEILAIGQTLATNGALNVSSSTAEIRVAIQNQRNQVSQLRMLLEAVRSADSLPLPGGSKLVVGVVVDDGVPTTYDLDSVMSTVYQEARELNETSLSMALSKLMKTPGTSPSSSPSSSTRGSATAVAPDAATAPPPPRRGSGEAGADGGSSRQFARRAGDRALTVGNSRDERAAPDSHTEE